MNDSPTAVPSGRMEAYLRLDDNEIFLLGWDYPLIEVNTNLPGPIIRYSLPLKAYVRMTLVLKDIKNPDMDSEYILLYGAGEKGLTIKIAVLIIFNWVIFEFRQQ